MADSIAGLKAADLNEIKKWREMGFTGGQIAKKMNLPPRKVSSALRYLKEHPYV